MIHSREVSAVEPVPHQCEKCQLPNVGDAPNHLVDLFAGGVVFRPMALRARDMHSIVAVAPIALRAVAEITPHASAYCTTIRTNDGALSGPITGCAVARESVDGSAVSW